MKKDDVLVFDEASITSKTNCLTPWDVQSRQIYTTNGTWMTLYAGQGGGRGYVMYENLSGDNRIAVCEQSSGQLHRAGCVQRYASGDREL